MNFMIVILLFGSAFGRIISSHDSKIVGGKDADIKDFPYQLSLRSNGKHVCGASVINENWSLTAAHCKTLSNIKYYKLCAGDSTGHQLCKGQLKTISAFIVHENYNSKTQDNDFALIKVKEPFVFSETVKPIDLSDMETKPGMICTISGWGAIKESGPPPEVLQQLDVPIVDHEVCNKKYEEYGGITNNMFCAGYDTPGRDSCVGDSGGPLVAKVGDKRYQLGVISYGVGCADPNYPGVYASVRSGLGWIKETIKNNS